MSEYVMDPGARLEVGPHGRLLESLGSLTGAFSPGVTYSVSPGSSAPTTMVPTAPTSPPFQLAPPGMVPGVVPPGYPPGVYPGGAPPMGTGIGFLGPDTNLYLIAAAVGVAGFIVYRRRKAARAGTTSNPARRRRRRR